MVPLGCRSVAMGVFELGLRWFGLDTLNYISFSFHVLTTDTS